MNLAKTTAIVLHSLKYGDNSIIVDTFTQEFGRMSFLVNGVNGKKSSFKPGLFQPLTLLELDIYIKNSRELQRIKEVKLTLPLVELRSNLVKNTLALFISEVLYKVLREFQQDKALFSYLLRATELLENQQHGIAHFHILFLMNLSRFLGFYPNSEFAGQYGFFDLLEGRFCLFPPIHTHFISGPLLQDFRTLLDTSLADLEQFHFSKDERSALLEFILVYYQIHMPGMSSLKSLSVLQEVFSV